jgi:hypothetical protein
MFRSAIALIADTANRRPTWLERDGGRIVEVRGFSPLDNVLYGALAAALILSPIVIFLVSAP